MDALEIARKIELSKSYKKEQQSSSTYGFLPYPALIKAYAFSASQQMKTSLFYPGQVLEFPVDTLISAINSYMGFFYIQAREQLYNLFKANM